MSSQLKRLFNSDTVQSMLAGEDLLVLEFILVFVERRN